MLEKRKPLGNLVGRDFLSSSNRFFSIADELMDFMSDFSWLLNGNIESRHFSFPKTNIVKTRNDQTGNTFYDLEMLVPGFSKEDIEVKVLDDSTLEVSGEIKEESGKEEKYEISEFVKNKRFSRKFLIPNIDDRTVRATYKNGILKISLSSNKRVSKTKIDIE